MKQSPFSCHLSMLVALIIPLIFAGCRGANSDEAYQEPEALVETTVAEVKVLSERLEAYGTVVAAPGARQTPAVTFESIVEKVLVTEGMPVRKGQTLLTLRPSPGAMTEISQATSALDASRDQLLAVQQRDSLGLATRFEIDQAVQADQNAQAQFDDVKQWENMRVVRAPASGVVVAVQATEGALLPAGAPLVDLASEDRFEIRFGVAPENAASIAQNHPVDIYRSGQTIDLTQGVVRSVGRAVRSDTRLVDVMVSAIGDSELLLGETVRGEIVIQSMKGVVVPRSAILPLADTFRAFTVRDGRAFGHDVKLGIHTDSLVHVISGLTVGDSVVVLGNYVLQDSTRIRTVGRQASRGGAL